jgi:phage shock protein A
MFEISAQKTGRHVDRRGQARLDTGAFRALREGVSLPALHDRRPAMLRTALIVFVAGTMLSPLAYGQKAAPQAGAAQDKAEPAWLRYRFSHTADGVMRLDNQTGQVTLCSSKNGAWLCDQAPEKSAQLQTEIERKNGDIDNLSAQVAQLKSGHAALVSELAALKQQLAETGQQAITQEERRGLVSRIALLEQDNSGLKGSLARLETESAGVKKQAALAQASADDAKSALAQAQGENTGLKSEIAALRQQVAHLAKNMTSQDAVAVQRAQIEHLAMENASLKDQMASLQDAAAAMRQQLAALTPPPKPSAPVPAPKDQELKLPSRADLDRAGAVLAQAWRRVVEMIDSLRKDITRHDDAPVRL